MDDLIESIKKLEQNSTPSILKDGYEIESVRKFLDYLGKPEESFPPPYTIHIGGTAGKGSTAHFISSLLSGHGIKCGLFTSPHISSPRERIKVNGVDISGKDFSRITNLVLDKSAIFCKEFNVRMLTYFEILLATALIYYKESGVRVAIIEVGLGGKLDPTNVLKGDVAVLTNIGLDHTKVLGDTIEKIALDKVEIIKEGSVCVSAFLQKSVVDIIQRKASSVGVKILLLDKEFGYKIHKENIRWNFFDYHSKELTLKDIRISLAGRHQVMNASLALTAFVQFCKLTGYKFDIQKIKTAMDETRIPGRIEIKSELPLIIWDSAHNEDKIKATVDTIDRLTDQDIVMLFAFKKGQNTKRLISPLGKLDSRVKKVVLTRYKLKQDVELESEPVKNFISLLQKTLQGSKIEFVPDPKKAYKGLLEEIEEKQMLLVTGSFYLLSSIQ